MILKILEPIHKNNFDQEGNPTSFGAPFARKLTFGLDDFVRLELFAPGVYHIGFLELIDEENHIYRFRVDEIMNTSLKAFDDRKNKAQRKLMLDALDIDYMLKDKYQLPQTVKVCGLKSKPRVD